MRRNEMAKMSSTKEIEKMFEELMTSFREECPSWYLEEGRMCHVELEKDGRSYHSYIKIPNINIHSKIVLPIDRLNGGTPSFLSPYLTWEDYNDPHISHLIIERNGDISASYITNGWPHETEFFTVVNKDEIHDFVNKYLYSDAGKSGKYWWD